MVTGASKVFEPSSLHSNQKTTTRILEVWLAIGKSISCDQIRTLAWNKPGRVLARLSLAENSKSHSGEGMTCYETQFQE